MRYRTWFWNGLAIFLLLALVTALCFMYRDSMNQTSFEQEQNILGMVGVYPELIPDVENYFSTGDGIDQYEFLQLKRKYVKLRERDLDEAFMAELNKIKRTRAIFDGNMQ